MSARDELKGCPFCRAEAVVEQTLHGRPVMKWIQCNGCGATSTAFNQVEHAKAAWNRRTPEPSTRVLRDGQPDDFTREQAAKRAEQRGEEYAQPTQAHYDMRNGCYDAAAAIRSMGEKL